jgi:hypothetical protein
MTEDVFANEFEQGHVRVGRSVVRNLSAATVEMEQTAVQRLTAEQVSASGTAIGVSNASTIELSQSAVGVAAGDYVKIEESKVIVLLAPRVSGNVKAYITLPVAFAFGAGYFVARRLLTALFSRGR